MLWLFLICILFHILCCLLIALLTNRKVLHVHQCLSPISLFLPFWGPLLVLLLHLQTQAKADGRKPVDLERFTVTSDLYQNFSLPDHIDSDTVVPLEEALIVNTPAERRKLIMDVLYENPKEYIEFLQKAGNNEDSEVVHYAVTAMVEITKENDYILQQFARRYSLEPNHPGLLDEYCSFLWNCLEQNLMKGQIEKANRILFADLIQKKFSAQPVLEDGLRMVQNYLQLKDYINAENSLLKLDKLWPDQEQIILLKLNYYSALKQGEQIRQLLKDLKNRQIYLSPKAKEVISFWNN